MYSYRIEQAIKAATILHQDQFRKGAVPLPYISHLIAVMLIVNDYTDSEDHIVAALLHDTLEDTDYSKDELTADFGAEVATIVETVSEPQSTDRKTYSWRERKQAYAKQLHAGTEGALLVSAADKIHNMRSIIEEYHQEPARFLEAFGGTLDERLQQYQDIANVLNRRLKNDILSEFNHVFTQYKEFIHYAQEKTKR